MKGAVMKKLDFLKKSISKKDISIALSDFYLLYRNFGFQNVDKWHKHFKKRFGFTEMESLKLLREFMHKKVFEENYEYMKLHIKIKSKWIVYKKRLDQEEKNENKK
jgi:hypothetical protein